MRKRIPGIVLTILCLFAGGMYAMRHGAGFFVPEHGTESMQGAERTADLTAASATEIPEPININTAGAKELEKLPGIGPAKAAAILEYRKMHGFFRVPEDLMKVSGIKEGTCGQLAHLITVGELPDIGSGGGWPGVLLPLEKAGAGREESRSRRQQESVP